MAINLICPRLTCRAMLRVPDDVRGQRVRCAECGVTFLVPGTKKATPSVPKESQPKGADAAS